MARVKRGVEARRKFSTQKVLTSQKAIEGQEAELLRSLSKP